MNSVKSESAIEGRFAAAQPLTAFIALATEHGALWNAIAARSQQAAFPLELMERARAIGSPRHMLVLLEDWCGDAINTIPILDAFAARVPSFTLRVLSRDANDDLMDAHLSPTGGKAIPVVIVYDEHFRELGWWGSRPAALQDWVQSDEAQALSKSERYAAMRRWYVQDRGVSTLAEVLLVLERRA
jgi:hypothetical protein